MLRQSRSRYLPLVRAYNTNKHKAQTSLLAFLTFQSLMEQKLGHFLTNYELLRKEIIKIMYIPRV